MLLSVGVPANSLTTSVKLAIDFSLCSHYNVSIKYLWFVFWQTKYLCIEASEGVCLWALFCFLAMIWLHTTLYLTVVIKRMDSIPTAHALFYIYPGRRMTAKNITDEVKNMVKDEFRSDVGKKFFAQHQAELEQGLQQLAHALGCNQNFPHSAEFFKAFIDGFWDPFQEACETGNQQQKEITQRIRSLEHQLRQSMTPDTQDILGQYSDLLAERHSTALDYAFLVGYQCAFRFLMMGLSPATMEFLQKEDEK